MPLSIVTPGPGLGFAAGCLETCLHPFPLVWGPGLNPTARGENPLESQGAYRYSRAGEPDR
jgi:hypothetical protein